MPGLFIESLTWPEVESALAEFDTLLLPVGARCKEHGPHLPLNTDFLVAEYLARRVVAACRVLAVPPIPYGYYPAFVEYPGSTHVRAAAFRDTVVDVCRSFARHGVRKCYVLNTGISTVAPLDEAKATLAAEDGVRMAFTDPREVGRAARLSVERQPVGTHADEIETSVMLYVAPEAVRLDRARPELAPDRPGPLTRDPVAASPGGDGGGVYSSSGAWGDPTLATADKGRLVTEAIVDDVVGFLRREFGV